MNVRQAPIRLFLCASGLLLLAAWLAITADFCAERARGALANSEWTAADRWLNTGKYCRGSRIRLWIIQARLFIKRGQTAEFESALQRATAAGAPEATILREQLLAAAATGQLGPLGDRLGQYLTAGEDLPEICEAFVLGCLSTYRLDQAGKILDLWQADFPRDPRPHFYRGRLLEHRSDFNGAVSEFEGAWKLAPNYAPAAFNLARILTAENKSEESLRWYRLAASKLVEPLPALIGEIRCLREMERFEEARQVLAAVGSKPIDRPQVDDSYRIVGEAAGTATAQLEAEIGQLELATKNYRAACDAFAKSVAANPRDWRTRYQYSIALRQSGDGEHARIEAEQVEAAKRALDACDVAMDILHKNPADVEARYKVGAAILDHVSENQGLIWLNSVLSYDPHHGPTHRKLAEFYAANPTRFPDAAKKAEWHRQQADLSGEKLNVPAP